MVPDLLVHPDLALALAVTESSTAPSLLLDGDLTLLAASKAFCDAFQIGPPNGAGRALWELESGEWYNPGPRTVQASHWAQP